jgi:hypothetical protein
MQPDSEFARPPLFPFVGHPLHAKFARLTAQEEKHGLLDDPSGIGTREGWARRLGERGFALKGHRLVRSNGQQNGLEQGDAEREGPDCSG